MKNLTDFICGACGFSFQDDASKKEITCPDCGETVSKA